MGMESLDTKSPSCAYFSLVPFWSSGVLYLCLAIKMKGFPHWSLAPIGSDGLSLSAPPPHTRTHKQWRSFHYNFGVSPVIKLLPSYIVWWQVLGEVASQVVSGGKSGGVRGQVRRLGEDGGEQPGEVTSQGARGQGVGAWGVEMGGVGARGHHGTATSG